MSVYINKILCSGKEEWSYVFIDMEYVYGIFLLKKVGLKNMYSIFLLIFIGKLFIWDIVSS